MALTPEQPEKTDSVQHGIAAADAFMAVFGLRRVGQKPEGAQTDKDVAMTEGWVD